MISAPKIILLASQFIVLGKKNVPDKIFHVWPWALAYPMTLRPHCIVPTYENIRKLASLLYKIRHSFDPINLIIMFGKTDTLEAFINDVKQAVEQCIGIGEETITKFSSAVESLRQNHDFAMYASENNSEARELSLSIQNEVYILNQSFHHIVTQARSVRFEILSLQGNLIRYYKTAITVSILLFFVCTVIFSFWCKPLTT